MEKELNGSNATFRLHYGGVFVRALATEYRDFGYVDIDREENCVCKWSFTTDLRGLGFKDEDVNGLHYRESTKTLTDGLRLIHDEASLYEMLLCANKMGLVELYVEHSED
nr:terminal uridylyltransferase 7 [Tanacetum cinerariifolium]